MELQELCHIVDKNAQPVKEDMMPVPMEASSFGAKQTPTIESESKRNMVTIVDKPASVEKPVDKAQASMGKIDNGKAVSPMCKDVPGPAEEKKQVSRPSDRSVSKPNGAVVQNHGPYCEEVVSEVRALDYSEEAQGTYPYQPTQPQQSSNANPMRTSSIAAFGRPMDGQSLPQGQCGQIASNFLMNGQASKQPMAGVQMPQVPYMGNICQPDYMVGLTAERNFDISIKIYKILVGDRGEVVDTCLDIAVNIKDQNGCNIGSENYTDVSVGDLKCPGFINKIPFGVVKAKNPKKYMEEYIGMLLETYQGERIKVYSRTGFNNCGGTNLYLTGDGVIGHPELPYRAKSDFHLRCGFQSPILPEIEHMLGVTKNPSKMAVLLLYGLSQLMHTLFSEAAMNLKYAVFLLGTRGSLKTSVGLAFTQYGDERNQVRFNFQGTESGIQSYFSEYTDRIMLVDDLPPARHSSDRKRQEKMLEMLLRLVGDDGGRAIHKGVRKKTDSEEWDYVIRGGLVLTGEYFYETGSESSMARTVVLEFERDEISKDLLSYFQAHPEILDAMTYRFICFVTDHYKEIVNLIRGNVDGYRRMAREYGFSNDRYAEYFAQLKVTAELLGRYLQEKEQVPPIEVQSLCKNLESWVLKVLTANEKRMKERAPIYEVLSAIVFAIHDGQMGSFGEKFSDKIRLVSDGNSLYFRQMDLPDIMKSYSYKTNRKTAGLSSQAIAKLLVENGFSQEHFEGGQPRKGLRYKEYGKVRLMSIPIEKIQAFEQGTDE